MTPQTRPGLHAGLSRRAALGLGALAGLGAAGCTLNNPLDEDETPAAEAVRDLAPDVAIAVQAVTLVGAARAAVARTTERHPSLTATLADLAATHEAHLDAVVDAVPDGVDTTSDGDAAYVVPGRPRRALAAVAAAERSLHDELVGLALRAESGPFARLLGAMAAAVSQRLAGLAA